MSDHTEDMSQWKIPELGVVKAGYDLLRNPEGALFLIDQWKSGEFIAENPSFSIVGIGLPREATDTPYGKIGAVLE